MQELQQQKKKLYMIKEEIESSMQMYDADINVLMMALDRIERLLRSIDKKYSLLENLVLELEHRKLEAEQDLANMHSFLKNQLMLEDWDNN